MGRTKGYSTEALKRKNARLRELMELEEYLIRDRRFFSNYTNDEFIEYELKHIEGMTKTFLVKFLKKYGYIKTNTGSTKIDDRDSVIKIYNNRANDMN